MSRSERGEKTTTHARQKWCTTYRQSVSDVTANRAITYFEFFVEEFGHVGVLEQIFHELRHVGTLEGLIPHQLAAERATAGAKGSTLP